MAEWRQVKEIFGDALELAPENRLLFLDEVCADDESLRREVESLLASSENDNHFMESAAIGEVAEMFDETINKARIGECFNHYEIIKQIGAGGMGEVYLARDKKLDRQVAIKILNEKFAAHESNLNRFMREAKAASALNHPNILVIHEIGESENVQYIVSEFIEGATLRELLALSTLKLSEVLDISIQTANALSAAHTAHIVHRDIKPENIIVRPDGYVKILDFGLAKLIKEQRSFINLEDQTAKQSETAQGIILGTVNYMSPEQAKGEKVDERTDIFSLGVVIYEMITGRTPFAGDSMSETFANLIKTDPLSLSRYTANVPDELQHAVAKMLRKNREERYQTMKGLLDNLRDLQKNLTLNEKFEKSHSPENRNATAVLQATTGDTNFQTAETQYSLSQTIKRNKLFAVFTFSILLAGAIGLTYFFLSQLRQFRQSLAFRQIAFSRLTNSGKVKLVALSPDGNLIAFVTAEKEGESLSVRQVGASNMINVVPPRKGDFVNVTFSADGKLIYYTFFSGGKADFEFYSVPVLGGVIQKVPNFVASVAPDGKHFVRPISLNETGETGLAMENFEGGDTRQLATRRLPKSFSIGGQFCSWSPDGEIIAVIGNNVDAQGSYSTIVGVNVRDGAEKPLTAKRWNYISNVEWRGDGKGLLVVGSDKPAMLNQIWFVSFPDGEVRKLTNDLNNYSSLGVSADGKLIVSVQTTQTSSLWIGEAGHNSSVFRQIASETGFLSPIALTADDRLIFRSNADGKSNLWTMRVDGGDRRQLTADAQADMHGICVTPDAKRIVFVSSLAGEYDLWRVDIDGENLTRLTSGEVETFPACSPDNQFVVSQKRLRTKMIETLWKIPLDGGRQTQLTDYYAMRPAISPDGKRVAFFHLTDEKWLIGIVSTSDGAIEQSFDVPDNVPDRIVRWAQNNRDLFYAANIGNIGNVWQLSPNGKTKRITDFDSNLLDDFTLSPDARKMAITRTTNLSDVVGITE